MGLPDRYSSLQRRYRLAETCIEVIHKGGQCTLLNRTAQTMHYPLIMPQVMDGIEHAAKHLAALAQMVQIGAGEVTAGIPIAARVQGGVVMAMDRVADLHHAGGGEQMTIARIARGQHANEPNHSVTYALRH